MAPPHLGGAPVVPVLTRSGVGAGDEGRPNGGGGPRSLLPPQPHLPPRPLHGGMHGGMGAAFLREHPATPSGGQRPPPVAVVSLELWARWHRARSPSGIQARSNRTRRRGNPSGRCPAGCMQSAACGFPGCRFRDEHTNAGKRPLPAVDNLSNFLHTSLPHACRCL
jgi:hypothetical protein